MNDGLENNVKDEIIGEKVTKINVHAASDGNIESALQIDNSSFTVQLSIELEQMHIPLKRLQALGEGAVLSLDLPQDGIPVRLVVGERALAQGKLVSVGPGYGVLIGGLSEG
jgi:flagellar motor switch/type III secretory pathway protein FliN